MSQSSRAVFYIMCGYPFAGKSTLVKEIIRKFNYALVTVDEVHSERGIGLDPQKPIKQEDWDIAYETAFNRIKENLLAGKTTIFDAPNVSKRERKEAQAVAKYAGSASKIIYINTPLEECRRRWIMNQETEEREHVREEDFQKALSAFEEPTTDENVLVYNNSQNVGEWIEDFFK